MTSRNLDDAIRHYISLGTEIPREKIFPGLDEGTIVDGVFASVTPFSDNSYGMPNMIDSPKEGGILESALRTRSYSISIYREGAFDAALRFDRWRQSNEGITSAEQSLVDGRIWGVIIYDGGEGCKKTRKEPDVIFHSPKEIESPAYRPATGSAIIDNEILIGIAMVDNGDGFTDNVPMTRPVYETESDYPSIEILFDYEKHPSISASGSGFTIRGISPIRDIGSVFSGEYEESSSFEISIAYEWALFRNSRFMEKRKGGIERSA